METKTTDNTKGSHECACEFFEKDPLLQCNAYQDGYLVPNDQDMQQFCLEHPKQCTHYQKVKHE